VLLVRRVVDDSGAVSSSAGRAWRAPRQACRGWFGCGQLQCRSRMAYLSRWV